MDFRKLCSGSCYFRRRDVYKLVKKRSEEREISLNGKKDKIHIVAGFVFLPVPGIFYEFTKAAGIPADKKDDIQASFERLSIHKRRDNRRFYFAHLCEEPENRSRLER
ncbi:conjugal transfer nickase/helicase domain-containing protein [Escherichia coli]